MNVGVKAHIARHSAHMLNDSDKEGCEITQSYFCLSRLLSNELS